MLVLTDIHIDPDYVEGTNGECNTIGGCCNLNSGKVKHEEDRAGYWGHNSKYSKCDLPYRFLDKTLQEIKKRFDNKEFDILVSLGDIHSHSFFKVKEEVVINANNYFIDSLIKYLPGVPVIPVLGNHETSPVDSFDFRDKQNFTIKNIYSGYLKLIDKEKI